MPEKFDINQLSQFAMVMVFVGAVAGVGAIVLSALSTASLDAEAETYIGYGSTALTNFTGQLGTVGTVMGVLFLLGLVVVALSGIGKSSDAV